MCEPLTIYGRKIPVSLHHQGKYTYYRASIYNGGRRPEEYQARSMEKLKERLKQVLPCSSAAATPEANGIDLIEWIWKWYWLNKEALSPATQLTYYGVIKSMEKYYAGYSLGITHEEAQNLIYKQHRAGLGHKSLNRVNTIARQAMELAMLHQLVRFNPFSRIKLPPQARDERLPLSHDEFALFLEAITLSQRCNELAVMVLAGLRIGECRGLCWEDVNFEAGTITVRRQRQKTIDDEGHSREVLQEKTKNGRNQTIIPPTEVFKFLRNEQIKQNYFKKINEARWVKGPDYVFTDTVGKCVTAKSVCAALNAAGLQCNRPDLTAHYLRHTAGTRMYELSGGDIRATQDFLRHANIVTTSLYVHTSMESKEKAMKQYDEYIRNCKWNNTMDLFDN